MGGGSPPLLSAQQNPLMENRTICFSKLYSPGIALYFKGRMNGSVSRAMPDTGSTKTGDVRFS